MFAADQCKPSFSNLGKDIISHHSKQSNVLNQPQDILIRVGSHLINCQFLFSFSRTQIRETETPKIDCMIHSKFLIKSKKERKKNLEDKKPPKKCGKIPSRDFTLFTQITSPTWSKMMRCLFMSFKVITSALSYA
jgi:hypothetical protein